MFKKVLIANRGEIACRVIRTLREMGIASVAVYSDADRHAAHVRLADEAARLGPAPAAESYLNVAAVLEACRLTGAEAVHPGYGFLSENPGFAEALADIGVAFIGPRPNHMRAFGLKHSARELALQAKVPLLPGSDLLDNAEAALAEAARIGYPVMLKSTAGGGGIGMQLAQDATELAAKFDTVQRLSANNFGDGRVFLEKFVARARHIEVQIFGDGKGGVIALGERDCSLQRRNQKVIEETPAPGLTADTRRKLHLAAVTLGQTVKYESAGTVEFVYDVDTAQFYFLEVNTRLQVEHGVTERVFRVDLVEWMIKQAAGEMDVLGHLDLQPQGHAIQARIYAEDPAKDFRPSAGLLTEVSFPTGIRIDSWVETGSEVSPYYDPLLAKIIVSAIDRGSALETLARALELTRIWGIETNLDYLHKVATTSDFTVGKAITASLKNFNYQPRTVDVIAPGAQSSLQDWPGRIGYWSVGVPPSGPMDDRCFRLANRVVGNAEGAPALEITHSGPTLRFNTATVIALGGARMAATLDEEPMPWWTPVEVKPGQVLVIGGIEGPGQRAYLAVRHGFDAPVYLGSRATFSLGKFGGHATGVLRTGDVLRLNSKGAIGKPRKLDDVYRPDLTREWHIGVLYGPHGAPDFFTEGDIETLFDSEYEVHFNSARTGVRLIGPKPEWAREDGGEAGLHPSNIHDNAYAIGAIDFTGDMPIILGPDGPSLGGFVCPAVIARAERWKMGQLKPGDKVRFWPLDSRPAVLYQTGDGPVPICCRRAGEDYLLVEYGPLTLDLELRLRVHLLMRALDSERPDGIIDLTPGIRSLQIHFDPERISIDSLLVLVVRLDSVLPPVDAVRIPSRIVHLPVSWNDEQAQLAMRKYQELVRPDAPWCPDNIEFIRRINGLDSIEDVYNIVFQASYLVLGLGDVYLGAPVATPIDPRHRLVTTKYNPARTWTPENAVGIGGAYLCVYGMEGPGGYQLFGRTIQMWNSWRKTELFERPWLLRFFDQIRFYPVSHDELVQAREDFPFGRYPVKIEETTLSLAEHRRFLDANADSIADFKTRQQAAFEAERRRWAEMGLATYVGDDAVTALPEEIDLPPGAAMVDSHVPGNVWQVVVEPGQSVAAGQVLVIVESMKMEMEIIAPQSGVVHEILCQPGRPVQAGQAVLVLLGAGE